MSSESMLSHSAVATYADVFVTDPGCGFPLLPQAMGFLFSADCFLLVFHFVVSSPSDTFSWAANFVKLPPTITTPFFLLFASFSLQYTYFFLYKILEYIHTYLPRTNVI